MYLSRMPINTARQGAWELLSSPYKMHAAVEHAFPPKAHVLSEEGRILWRLDAVPGDNETAYLYVVSPSLPDFTHISEQVGWPTVRAWETKDYAPVLDYLAGGQRWAFRLKANPVRKVFKNRSDRSTADVIGTIQGHVTEAQQIEWLLSRAEGRGFRVVEDEVAVPLVNVSQRHRQKFVHKGSEVTLVSAVYDGILEVTDVEAFRRTLCFGVGRAKGFGCGLLTVAPVQGDSR